MGEGGGRFRGETRQKGSVTGDLSALTEAHLRDYLAEVRRIAALDDVAALVELDTMLWGASEMITTAAGERPDVGDWLSQGREAGTARFQEDLAAARANLEHPERIAPWDGLHLRQSAGIYTDDAGARREALAVADELEIGYAGVQIERALAEPITSTASLPKHHRAIGFALMELEKRGRLTPALRQRARAARERLARYRAQKKLDDAAVAEAGGNAKKAAKLRAEAAVVLSQDWSKAFPGEPPPLAGLSIPGTAG
jgi:hypothetical protein